jgi:hypothetical protein
MSSAHDPHEPVTRVDGGRRGPRRRRSGRTVAGIAFTAIAAVVLASQTLLAPAAPAGVPRSTGLRIAPAVALVPPAGMTWIEGVITDQAAHGQDDVNVEAWPRDPSAVAPVASALTYGGPPDGSALHGFFLLQVPSAQAYRIVFSAVAGQEDGDAFRMRAYGHGRPIAVRNLAVAAGRVRDLGTIALARQGHVASRTKVVLARAKVAAGKRATVRIRVSSAFVTNVTGKVVVRVGGKKAVHRLAGRSHGRAAFKLPHIKKAGRYKVTAAYAGSGTVHRSKAKPVRLTIHR